MFTLTAAYTVALAVSCVFFGLAFATFILCMRALCVVPFKSFTRVRWALFVVSCGTSLIAAVSIAQGLRRLLLMFIYHKNGTAPLEVIDDPHDISNWLHSLTYPIQGFLGDSVLVYRTWIVNNRDWRYVVLPILLVIGGTACGFGIGWSMSLTKSDGFLNPIVTPWTSSFVAVSLVLNIICTGLIIGRILRVTRKKPSGMTTVAGSRPSLEFIQRVIIESGLMYAVTSLILFIMGVVKVLAVFIVADCYVQIIPICFNLIIIRTSNYRDEKNSQTWEFSNFSIRFVSHDPQHRRSVSDLESSAHSRRQPMSPVSPLTPAANDIQMGVLNRSARDGVFVSEEKWNAI